MTREGVRWIGPIAGVVLLAALAPGIASAQDVQPSPRERAERWMQLQREVAEAFQNAKYVEAEPKLQELLKLQPNDAGTYYNLACTRARLGNLEAAAADLAKAVELGWDDADHTRQDEDLDRLRNDKRFIALLEKMSAGVAPVRKTQAGQTVIEGKVGGGFRYRVRLSETATAKRPQRLVVWLHPSGGSMNDVAEGLAPMFRRHGLGMVVFEGKDFRFWSSTDAHRLGRTMVALSKLEGVDVDRPVLMGFSAGGQMALLLWANAPDGWGGLILDAAYPIRAVGEVGRRGGAMDLPKDSAALRGTPMFVVVGTLDGGSGLWKSIEGDWKTAGVPLTVVYVEGGRHAWLLGEDQQKQLDQWLTTHRPAEAATNLTTGSIPYSTIEAKD